MMRLVESHHDLMSLFEHDLFGKPVSPFPDHALERPASGWPHLRECSARQDNTHGAQRTLPAVPGDTRQRVQIGPPLRLDNAWYRRYGAEETRLFSHHRVFTAPRCAVAKRIGEMPDAAMERSLCDRPPHRHFALRNRVLQARQDRVTHRGASER